MASTHAKGRTIIVTGGAGFLGRHICQLLTERGDTPVNFDVAPLVSETPVINRIGQIGDLSALIRACRESGANGIIHTVALQDNNQNPVATYQLNVMGAVNVLEAVRLSPAERAVLVSSEAAYHATISNPMSEGHPVISAVEGSPGAHYGASKAAADIIAMAYYSYDGLDVRVARLSSLYGPGMRASMYIRPMIENSVEGQPTVFETGGDMRRDYTHVLDAAAGIIAAYDAEPETLSQRIFNISSGITVTASDVAAVVRRVVPGADIQIGSGMTDDERRSVRTRGTLDISAARRDLGYEPRFDLENGVRQYVQTIQHPDGADEASRGVGR